ncbi:MAG: precorrin-8X methylmutase [Planctomycetes bacterium]|nr:precorrin-8X methylmutase [Planctomycetota bacterium]
MNVVPEPLARILEPAAIEAESFRIIEEELGPHRFTPEEFQVVRRVIHASADFEFAKNLRFGKGAIASAVAALRGGCDVVCDVQMVQAGVSEARLKRFGGKARVFIADPDIVEEAKRLGITRAICAMRKAAQACPGAVYAIGNAPTALLEATRLALAGEMRPACIVGVPVGFVSAAESKEAVAKTSLPYIAALGRKGGTPVAVSIVNALLILAEGA